MRSKSPTVVAIVVVLLLLAGHGVNAQGNYSGGSTTTLPAVEEFSIKLASYIVPTAVIAAVGIVLFIVKLWKPEVASYILLLVPRVSMQVRLFLLIATFTEVLPLISMCLNTPCKNIPMALFPEGASGCMLTAELGGADGITNVKYFKCSFVPGTTTTGKTSAQISSNLVTWARNNPWLEIKNFYDENACTTSNCNHWYGRRTGGNVNVVGPSTLLIVACALLTAAFAADTWRTFFVLIMQLFQLMNGDEGCCDVFFSEEETDGMMAMYTKDSAASFLPLIVVPVKTISRCYSRKALMTRVEAYEDSPKLFLLEVFFIVLPQTIGSWIWTMATSGEPLSQIFTTLTSIAAIFELLDKWWKANFAEFFDAADAASVAVPLQDSNGIDIVVSMASTSTTRQQQELEEKKPTRSPRAALYPPHPASEQPEDEQPMLSPFGGSSSAGGAPSPSSSPSSAATTSVRVWVKTSCSSNPDYDGHMFQCEMPHDNTVVDSLKKCVAEQLEISSPMARLKIAVFESAAGGGGTTTPLAPNDEVVENASYVANIP